MPRRVSSTGAAVVSAVERTRQAVALRRAGLTCAEIGAKLGCSKASAHRAIVRGLEALRAESQEDATALRTLELARLDAAQVAIWRDVQAGDMAAIDRLLRISQRRASLLGLDQQRVSTDVRVDMGETGADVLARLVALVTPKPDGDPR